MIYSKSKEETSKEETSNSSKQNDLESFLLKLNKS